MARKGTAYWLLRANFLNVTNKSAKTNTSAKHFVYKHVKRSGKYTHHLLQCLRIAYSAHTMLHTINDEFSPLASDISRLKNRFNLEKEIFLNKNKIVLLDENLTICLSSSIIQKDVLCKISQFGQGPQTRGPPVHLLRSYHLFDSSYKMGPVQVSKKIIIFSLRT
jgi:hypothetical protein